MRGSTLGVDDVDPLVPDSVVVTLPDPVEVVAEPVEVVAEPLDVVEPELLGEPVDVVEPESLGEPEAEEFPGDGGTDAGFVDFDTVGVGVVHG